MEPIASREVAIRMRFATVPACLDGLSLISCLSCRKPLDIHQPDPDLPERILATCEACKSWHLVDYDPATDLAVVVLLPDGVAFRAVTQPSPSPSTPIGMPGPGSPSSRRGTKGHPA